MIAPRWKLWYSDGSSYSELDGPPERAPAFGVQVITQQNEETGRYNQCMDDFYVWRKGRWFGCDKIGLIDYLAHEAPCIVRFGRTEPNDVFYRILKKAEADPEFPVRSAWKKGELRP